MLDVGKLATLCEVVERRSFSAAAIALNLTQPAVSRQISVLEAQVATQLVRRSRRGVVPTEAGELLVSHAQGILGRLRTAEDDVAALVGLRAGRVRIGMFFTAFAVLAPEMQAHAEQRLRNSRSATSSSTARRRSSASSGRARPGGGLRAAFDPCRLRRASAQRPLRRPGPGAAPRSPSAGEAESLTLDDLDGETWIRPREGSEEPVEAQVHVAAGAGIARGYELNVILNPPAIAVRALRTHLRDESSSRTWTLRSRRPRGPSRASSERSAPPPPRRPGSRRRLSGRRRACRRAWCSRSSRS